jgi:hypothetical protein
MPIFKELFMSCTRRIAELFSKAVPYIESLEINVTKNVSAAAVVVRNKSAELVTQENAKKAYGYMQNVFTSCRRKNKGTTAKETAAPVVEERPTSSKKVI